MKKVLRFFGLLLLFVLMTGCAAKYGVADYTPMMDKAAAALDQARERIGAQKNDTTLLVLTNAASGQMAGEAALPYLDVAMQSTGATLGTGSLLPVHSSCTAPLWFSLYNRNNGKLAYIVGNDDAFDVQYLDAAPDRILTAKGWDSARRGVIAPNLFRVVGISLAWAAGADRETLKSAQLHDHLCPGVSAGIAVSEYILRKCPPTPDEKFVFIGASPFCAMDAYQAIFNATPGKHGSFSMQVGQDVLEQYGLSGSPACIFLRINAKKDTCSGSIFMFDFEKAASLAGLRYTDLRPEGGPSNPMFFISRVKIGMALARLTAEEKVALVSVVKSFSGTAGLAARIQGANADPYAFIE